MNKLKYNCIFCDKLTNFKDGGNAYCVDCYVKIRNSAHTHLPVNPWPVTPLPTTPYGDEFGTRPRLIC